MISSPVRNLDVGSRPAGPGGRRMMRLGSEVGKFRSPHTGSAGGNEIALGPKDRLEAVHRRPQDRARAEYQARTVMTLEPAITALGARQFTAPVPHDLTVRGRRGVQVELI